MRNPKERILVVSLCVGWEILKRESKFFRTHHVFVTDFVSQSWQIKLKWSAPSLQPWWPSCFYHQRILDIMHKVWISNIFLPSSYNFFYWFPSVWLLDTKSPSEFVTSNAWFWLEICTTSWKFVITPNSVQGCILLSLLILNNLINLVTFSNCNNSKGGEFSIWS